MREFRPVALFAWRGGFDNQPLVLGRDCRSAQRLHEARCGSLADLKVALIGGDPDRTDVRPADVTVTADEWKQPSRISIVAAAGIESEPTGSFEPGA